MIEIIWYNCLPYNVNLQTWALSSLTVCSGYHATHGGLNLMSLKLLSGVNPLISLRALHANDACTLCFGSFPEPNLVFLVFAAEDVRLNSSSDEGSASAASSGGDQI